MPMPCRKRQRGSEGATIRPQFCSPAPSPSPPHPSPLPCAGYCANTPRSICESVAPHAGTRHSIVQRAVPRASNGPPRAWEFFVETASLPILLTRRNAAGTPLPRKILKFHVEVTNARKNRRGAPIRRASFHRFAEREYYSSPGGGGRRMDAGSPSIFPVERRRRYWRADREVE